MAEGRPAKSRNGCGTCKVRKVKCDEQKPDCHRCKSTGRRCEGYRVADQSREGPLRIIQHVPICRAPQPAVQLTRVEQQSFDFFQRCTIPSFGVDLGCYLLPAASSDPILQSVAIAVGSVHRAFTFRANVGTDESHFALRYYNKAIRELVTRSWQSSAQANIAVLMACVLFFCCESLQGHYKTALQHASSGLRILQQQEAFSGGSSKCSPAPVLRLFHSLQNQILEIEGAVSISYESLLAVSDSPASTPSKVLDIDQIQRSFEPLYSRFIRLDAIAEEWEAASGETVTTFDVELAPKLHTEVIEIRSDLTAWICKFDEWIATNEDEVSQNDHRTIILKIWKLLIGVYLQMEWPPAEMLWDNFTDVFTNIVTLASIIVDPTDPSHYLKRTPPTSLSEGNKTKLPTLLPKPSTTTPKHPTFSLTIGIITPLYVCATRSRNSHIRYRAIDLLSRCRRREGLWDSDLASRVAKQFTLIEERAAGIPPGVPYQPGHIGRSTRVKSLSPRFDEGRQGTLRYTVEVMGEGEREEVVTW
ncbi:hypothetical protein BO70DRAFT_284324 [Aspergillus heteromorphus CBS 117.55]|uniref:Zn(2)-C6 fungal-type domain-containing protein n=1 Tax=Aspergillus heteromorphus CBS 117.55 TaxID=1448321 RepID=A0A317WZI0_9EURO|nr:uncharacterized protein BO70DRAFT_284324 [Aspergillus heteromorphus CBS 117.55]PWY90677.1 hypothetical protein BO70DRAFT_284324 [Aspergillus heteromorphus CBS 117.55]